MPEDNTATVRLNKAISDTGFCSRREADILIEEGRVTVNGEKAILGLKVTANDDVRVDGKPIVAKEKPVYIAFNKPIGIICTTEKNVRNNIIDFINHPKRIFPIGRLDKPSEGLIFLTSDGNIVNKILRSGNAHEKEYIVKVNKPVTTSFINQMSNGVPVLDTVTLKCFAEKTGSHEFKIILKQGLNRQIRRMCDYLGYDVVSLQRTRIMNVTLDHIPIGTWRDLTEEELKFINDAVAQSSMTEEASFIDGKEEDME